MFEVRVETDLKTVDCGLKTFKSLGFIEKRNGASKDSRCCLGSVKFSTIRGKKDYRAPKQETLVSNRFTPILT